MTVNATDPPLASQGRRLAGAVLDRLIFVLTLGIGWVIWYLVAARGGQSRRSGCWARVSSARTVRWPA